LNSVNQNNKCSAMCVNRVMHNTCITAIPWQQNKLIFNTKYCRKSKSNILINLFKLP
jgi:hypothetical protein